MIALVHSPRFVRINDSALLTVPLGSVRAVGAVTLPQWAALSSPPSGVAVSGLIGRGGLIVGKGIVSEGRRLAKAAMKLWIREVYEVREGGDF
jgi:hypothetical protein